MHNHVIARIMPTFNEIFQHIDLKGYYLDAPLPNHDKQVTIAI